MNKNRVEVSFQIKIDDEKITTPLSRNGIRFNTETSVFGRTVEDKWNRTHVEVDVNPEDGVKVSGKVSLEPILKYARLFPVFS